MNAHSLAKVERLNVQQAEVIDVDMPFDAREVESATCERYVMQLTRSDMPIVRPGTAKKGRAAARTEHVFDPIDVDMPFSAAEVAALTSDAYVAALGPSDMPVVGRWQRQ